MATTYITEFTGLHLTSSSATGVDQEYTLKYITKSSAPSNVASVLYHLVEDSVLPDDLTGFEPKASGVNLSTFTCVPAEPRSQHCVIFNGVAKYRKRDASEGNKDSNPSSNVITVDFRSNKYDRVVVKAKNENGKVVPVLNSAGARFADPIVDVDERLVIVLGKNYEWNQITPAFFSRYFNSVNINPIQITDVPICRRGGWMLSIQPTVTVQSYGTYQWDIRYEIEVKGHGRTYDREVLDQGLSFFVEVGDDYGPGIVLRDDGTHVRRERVLSQNGLTGEMTEEPEPVLLDGNGGLLKDIALGNEVYLKFRVKPEEAWNALSLPATFTAARGG